MNAFIKTGFWTKTKKDYKSWLNLDKLIDDKISTIPKPKYKVYTALLNQSETNPPVATILENTTGLDFVWIRETTGQFKVSTPNNSVLEDIESRIVISFKNRGEDTNVSGLFLWSDRDYLIASLIKVKQISGGAYVDYGINNVVIEVRIYNEV